VLGTGVGAPVIGRSTEEVAHTVEVPARTAEASGGMTVALEEEEAGLLHPEVGHRSSRHSVSRGVSLIFSVSRSQGGADRPPPLHLPMC
jgi:hypothetical protein